MKNLDEDVANNQDLTWDTNATVDNTYENITQLKSEMAELKGQHIFLSFFLFFFFSFCCKLVYLTIMKIKIMLSLELSSTNENPTLLYFDYLMLY